MSFWKCCYRIQGCNFSTVVFNCMHNPNAEADYLINYIPIVYNPGYCGSEKRNPQITSAWLTNTNLHLAWEKDFLAL